MSILSSLPIIGDIFKGATDLISEAITDKDKKIAIEAELKRMKAEFEYQLLSQENELQLAQIDVNKEQAKSKSFFVSGGRPFIIWTCGVSFASNFILLPILTWMIPIISIWVPEAKDVKLPGPFDMSVMLPVLLGLLGLGGMRSFEKSKGVNNK